MKNMNELRKLVKPGVKISKEGKRYYAFFVEKNGDEFSLTNSTDLDFLRESLKGFQLVKGDAQ